MIEIQNQILVSLHLANINPPSAPKISATNEEVPPKFSGGSRIISQERQST